MTPTKEALYESYHFPLERFSSSLVQLHELNDSKKLDQYIILYISKHMKYILFHLNTSVPTLLTLCVHPNTTQSKPKPVLKTRSY